MFTMKLAKAALAGILMTTTLLATHTSTQAQAVAYVGGIAYLDKNVNGKRDPGEPTTYGLYKVTAGGSWFTCGTVGRGSNFAVPVNKTGSYYVMPIAQRGFHTTTPIIKVDVKESGKSYSVEMGFAQDPAAQPEACGQYAPKRVIRPNGLGILETAMAAGNFSTLRAALDTAGLTDALLTGGPFTVFAPSDLAFAKLTDEELAAVLADKELLTKILTFHVVPGRISANDVVNGAVLKTLQGTELKAEVKGDDVFINGARIVATDISTANGIIHVIDAVMIP